MTEAPPTQQTLGRYTLLRRLAAGGMGEVYLGEVQGAANFTKQVAIKRILPHLAANKDFVDKFIDEAHVMVQLHHGNIVPVLELADEEGELFLVMEYLPGRDLKAVLRRLRRQGRPLPVDLACWLAAEICAGLDYAHRKVDALGQPLGIVHRDVSPSNVMVGAGGEVKLVDFGIARARGGLHQSISGTLQGKFVYMSPEQADGRGVDQRCDVFAAGMVLYEMLTGVRPHEGQSETETLRLIREASIPPPSTHREAVPPELDAIVGQALAKRPGGRFDSAATFRRALLHFLGDRRSQADAANLGRLLSEIFPEGVVPRAEPVGPMSLDDALMAQLGAMTPSVERLGNTRTLTGPKDAAGLPLPGPAPEPSPPLEAPAASSPGLGSLPSSTLQVPRRRALWPLAAALLAGGAVFAWFTWPRTTGFEPQVEPAGVQGVTFRLGREGPRLPLPYELTVGVEVEICAEAPGFAPDCVQVRPKRSGGGPIAFRLAPSTREVRFQAQPSDATITIEADGRELGRGQGGLTLALPESVISVRVEADGHEPIQRRVDLGRDRRGTFRFTLDVTPVPDGAPPTPAADAGSGRPVSRRPLRTYTLDTLPAGATVLGPKGPLGTTPLDVPPGTYELKLAGYEPLSARIRRGARRITLTAAGPPGYLTARVYPPSALLTVHGEKSEETFNRLPLPPGRYDLRGSWKDPAPTGRVHSKRWPVEIRAGEETNLGTIYIVPRNLEAP